jgi:hypothetical protein
MASELITRLQQAKTALEKSTSLNEFRDLYKMISSTIYHLETREGLPYGWRDCKIKCKGVK